MRRAFWLVVAASLGFWLDESLHQLYRFTLHARPRATTHRRRQV